MTRGVVRGGHARFAPWVVSALVMGSVLLWVPWRALAGRNVASLLVVRHVLGGAQDSARPAPAKFLQSLLRDTAESADPRSAKFAHLALGLIERARGNESLAVEQWRLGDTADFWEQLARGAWNVRDVRLSMACYERAISVSPGRMDNYFRLAWLNWPTSGNLEGAARAYAAAATAAAPGSFDYFLARAYGSFLRQQWTAALDWAEAAARTNSRSGDAHRLAGRAAGRLGRHSLAIEHLKMASVLSPKDSCICVELADEYRDSGAFAEAAGWYTAATRLEPTGCAADRGYASLGERLAQEGDVAGAIRQLERAVALSPGTSIHHLRLGELYERAGLRTLAAAEFRGATELDPADRAAREALSRVLGGEGSTVRPR